MGHFKDRKEGKVIAFLNQKGGVGKTTLTYNMAYALRERGHQVLCLDLDPQANLTYLFGLIEDDDENTYDENASVFQLLVNSVRELKAKHYPILFSDAICHNSGVDILPSSPELSGFELSVASVHLRPFILKRFIEKNALKERYDYILIDGPPTLGLLVINILCAADSLIVPFRPDQFSSQGLKNFHDVLDEVDDMGVTAPKVIAYVPNLVDPRRKQEAKDFEKIEMSLRKLDDQAKVVNPFYNKVPLVKCLAEKKSVFDFKGKEFLTYKNQFLDLAQIIEQGNE